MRAQDLTEVNPIGSDVKELFPSLRTLHFNRVTPKMKKPVTD